MDVLVTVAASVLHCAVGEVRPRQRVALVVQRSRMPCIEVAALAEIGHLRLQQFLVIGAVWVVAVEAVLADRRVLPHERAALLRMTGVAQLIDRRGANHLRLHAVVRVVTTRALHAPFPNRMMARAHRLRAHVLVTCEARVADLLRLQLCSIRLEVMNAVAGGAGEVLPVVNAPAPVRLASSVMTRQAKIGRVLRAH